MNPIWQWENKVWDSFVNQKLLWYLESIRSVPLRQRPIIYIYKVKHLFDGIVITKSGFRRGKDAGTGEGENSWVVLEPLCSDEAVSSWALLERRWWCKGQCTTSSYTGLRDSAAPRPDATQDLRKLSSLAMVGSTWCAI